jgi:hypothetical protein
MLIDELLARKAQLESEMESLLAQIQPLEESFKKKHEMVQHVTRMIELEGGIDSPESPSGSASESPPAGEGGPFRSSMPDAQVVPIFVHYRGQRYDAELERAMRSLPRQMDGTFRCGNQHTDQKSCKRLEILEVPT